MYDMLTGRPPFYSKNQLEMISKKIDKKSIPIPNRLSPDARSLLEQLLKIKPEKRLGSNGSMEIKDHPFFRDIDFDKLLRK